LLIVSFLFLLLSVLLRAIGVSIALPGLRYSGTSVWTQGSSFDLAAMLIRFDQSKSEPLTIQPDLVLRGLPPAVPVFGIRPGNTCSRPLVERFLIRT